MNEVQRRFVSLFFIRMLYKILGWYTFTNQPLLGAKAVALLMFAPVSGILMALFLNNVGGAWIM